MPLIICYLLFFYGKVEITILLILIILLIIIAFKQDKNKKTVNKRALHLEKTLAIKFCLYFIISSIFLLFFWYYISLLKTKHIIFFTFF